MKILLAFLFVIAMGNIAQSQNIPLGYDCTFDADSICINDGRENAQGSPAAEPSMDDEGDDGEGEDDGTSQGGVINF